MLYFNTTQLSAFWFSVARTTGNPVYASRKHLVLKTNPFEEWIGYWMKMPDIDQTYIEAGS